jgi:hypothetical protein
VFFLPDEAIDGVVRFVARSSVWCSRKEKLSATESVTAVICFVVPQRRSGHRQNAQKTGDKSFDGRQKICR